MTMMSLDYPAITHNRGAGIACPALTVEVHREMTALEPLWREFERHAACTVFQTFRWLSAWLATAGAMTGVEPAIICARASAGDPVAILPFAITRRRGIRMLGWLGGRHANYQFGLFSRQWLETVGPTEFGDLWRDIIAALPAFDLVCFADQPETWDGFRNPFFHLPHQRSANRSHVLHLTGDYEALYASKRSSATRRSARKRDKRLEQEGLVEFRRPGSRAEATAALETLFRHKLQQMAAIGVGDVYGREFRAFITELAETADGDASPLDIRCLTCGGETAATVLGAVGMGRYFGLILSMTDGPLRRHSPGEIALRYTIRACCASGLREFDLSQGEAGYKAAWADDHVAQFDTVIGYTARGHVYAAVARLALWAKRLIKESPRVLSAANAVRRRLFGRNDPPGRN